MSTIVEQNDAPELSLDTTLTELAPGDGVRVMRFVAPADCYLVYSGSAEEGDPTSSANRFKIPAGMAYPIVARTGRKAFVAAVAATVTASVIGLGLAVTLLAGGGEPSGGGGGGTPATPDHDDLGHLDWELGQHTGDPDTLAAFDGTGEATYAEIGSDVQAWDPALDALISLAGTGLVAQTADGVFATRTLQPAAAGLTWANAGGVAGNPTPSLADDLLAVENLATTGYAIRTAASTWVTRAILAGGGIVITSGDGISAPTTIATTAASFVVTATGYTTVTLPSDCSAVAIRCKGSGAGGGGGTTGNNASNRAGGGGGGPAPGMNSISPRGIFDTSLEVYVAAGGAAGTPGISAGNGKISLVEVVNTGFAGTTTPQVSSTVAYSGTVPGLGVQGALGGGAGGGGVAPALTGALWARLAWSVNFESAGNGSNGGASGVPTDLSPFTVGTSPSAGGCGGGGKNTTPTAANGGRHAAFGHLAATVGGVAPAGAGNTPAGAIGATVDRQTVYYGGTGGASDTTTTAGAGGAGDKGCGGGGGGAGITGGGGGVGGDGFVVIRAF